MKVAPVSNICYLVFPAHLCPVRPRVLDSCSLIYRAIHIREVYGTPLSQSLIRSYFLGPQVVWGFITILYLCHALLLYLRLCEVLHTVLFRTCDPFTWYRQSPIGDLLSFTAGPTNFGVRLGASLLRCGYTPRGGPLKYF